MKNDVWSEPLSEMISNVQVKSVDMSRRWVSLGRGQQKRILSSYIKTYVYSINGSLIYFFVKLAFGFQHIGL